MSNTTSSPQSSLKRLWRYLLTYKEFQFALFFVPIFLATFIMLYALGLVPSEFQETTSNTILDTIDQSSLAILKGTSGNGQQTQQISQASSTHAQGETPVRISIPKLGTDSIIRNPASTDVDVLDQELTKGVVHYPGSGALATGDMFLFGHSTTFKVVNNKAYKVFNDLDKLVAGDIINVYSGPNSQGISTMYTYKVRDVQKLNENNAWVTFDSKATMLTLSTCDGFGKKTDRFVVQADFVGSMPQVN